MGYNLLLLINQTNNELIQRNKKYLEIILEFEKNFTHFFEKYCDYSNLFNESLNSMYNQVQNFSGEFFYQLIDLINRVYNNYSIILEDVKLGEYDFISKIRNITKDEYIKYIYNQLETLEIFENKTLLFLDNLENELYNIKDFQVDVLYDIIDSISDSKQIFKKFNKNLFESIEKGILKFKCDINDHIDNIIGEFLFITEFLSVNINKNEIFIRAIDEETRKEVAIKLKNFRIMVNSIIDLLNSNINDDYEKEMNLLNNESIKFISIEKAFKFLTDIENESDHLIKNIKSKINNFNNYELYSENLNIINDINNKTIIEYINDFYKNVIYQMKNIKPEYLNKTSDIHKNQKLLFNLAKNITNIINTEIKEINEYIFTYTKNYIEKIFIIFIIIYINSDIIFYMKKCQNY